MDHLDRFSIARKDLRSALLERREGIAEGIRRVHDANLVARLTDCPLLAATRTIAVYVPIRSEPDLRPLVERWWDEGRTIALPIVRGAGQPLAFAAWRRDTVLVVARFGVSVPRDVEPVEPDALVMPCVGFRQAGGRSWRLGYGAGFYDRTLAHRPMPSVGVAYDESETDAFEPAPYDVPLTVIATPSRCITSIASP